MGVEPPWPRNYRLLLAGSAVTNPGDGVSAVAMPWPAALPTGDPLMISAVATAEDLPWLLSALPAGVRTDRADRRRMMFRADRAWPFAAGHGPQDGMVPVERWRS